MLRDSGSAGGSTFLVVYPSGKEFIFEFVDEYQRLVDDVFIEDKLIKYLYSRLEIGMFESSGSAAERGACGPAHSLRSAWAALSARCTLIALEKPEKGALRQLLRVAFKPRGQHPVAVAASRWKTVPQAKRPTGSDHSQNDQEG